MNPRLHGKGDFVTFERRLNTDKVHDGWAEFCNTWASNWSYVEQLARANGFILGQLARSRSLGINYLLGIGPMKTGGFAERDYRNLAVVADWMKANGESIRGTRPLPKGETASVPAVAKGNTRYLFAVPQFKDNGMFEDDQLPPSDVTLTLKGAATKNVSAKLLGDGSALSFEIAEGAVAVQLPADKRTKLLDVVRIDFGDGSEPAASR